MNTIVKIINWYENLDDNCRFLAFCAFVLIPFIIMLALFPIAAVVYGMWIIYFRYSGSITRKLNKK